MHGLEGLPEILPGDHGCLAYSVNTRRYAAVAVLLTARLKLAQAIRVPQNSMQKSCELRAEGTSPSLASITVNRA